MPEPLALAVVDGVVERFRSKGIPPTRSGEYVFTVCESVAGEVLDLPEVRRALERARVRRSTEARAHVQREGHRLCVVVRLDD